MFITPITPRQRSAIVESIRQALIDAGASPGAVALDMPSIEKHLDALVSVARYNTARRPESYMAQVLDRVCGDCDMQYASGFCALRNLDHCAVYRLCVPIVDAIARVLRDTHDVEYEQRHSSRSQSLAPAPL